MLKSEKYQQDKVMIKHLLVYWVLLISRKIKDVLLAVDLSKQKALDTDSRVLHC